MESYQSALHKIKEYGIVEEVNPPIIICSGLPGAMPNEIVIFENGEMGQILSLLEDKVEIIIFTQNDLQPGIQVTRTGEKLQIPVGKEYLGKTIDPLGEIIFKGKDNNIPKLKRSIESTPLKLKERKIIKRQLITGVTLIDTLLPLGKGQRELIVGDRKTGKTSALLTIVNTQHELGDIIIYALIGKKKEEIKRIVEYLKENKLDKNTVVVASSSQDSPSLIELTPYSAMTLAEHFREEGNDVLVIFDDLSTHAKFYREISLIAKRFPGRESFPGDIFYKHAKLLERGGHFVSSSGKENSITCLPIAETIQGNLTDHIVSNIISITDGHILFDSESFNKGRRPAVNIFLSVTRVGKQTQNTVAREISQTVMSFLIRYEKALEFSHFGAELSEEVKDTIDKGNKIYGFFEQNYQKIVPLEIQQLGVGLIWSSISKALKTNEMPLIRDKAVKCYEGKEFKILVNQILNADNIAELVKNIEQNKVKIMQALEINQAEQKAPSKEETPPPENHEDNLPPK